MLRFLRKIFLIDFILSIVRPKQLPHKRFAGFLSIFAYMWLGVAIFTSISLLDASQKNYSKEEYAMVALWVAAGIFFFFFYRYTSKILNSYEGDVAHKFGYLKYINPIAPVIYTTTIGLFVIAVINVFMMILFAIGMLLYILIILITLGLILFEDSFKLDDFIGMPKRFFDSEEYFLNHIISPEWIILFLVLIYFIIPFTISTMIIWKHKTDKN